MPAEDGFNFGNGPLDTAQPPLARERVESAARNLAIYRIMAFVTGTLLLAGTIALILKYAASVNFGGVYALLWIGHGYLYLIYVVVATMLGVKLRWPPARIVLVLLAGTIPTMSFVAEHYVTRDVRKAVQPATAG